MEMTEVFANVRSEHAPAAACILPDILRGGSVVNAFAVSVILSLAKS
jgi:hypothetical protein